MNLSFIILRFRQSGLLLALPCHLLTLTWIHRIMKDTYELRIKCGDTPIKEVEGLLGRNSSNTDSTYWEWLIENDSKPSEAFSLFLDLLTNQYDRLAKIGIARENISIWRNYQYDQECNLEISPEQMKSLGEQGIVLCISCWQHH